ncbi:MAG: DMT family transporter [Geminicoccaceae bacterium]|nr:DMT family transporter [Geminicoccaceae bacterium]
MTKTGLAHLAMLVFATAVSTSFTVGAAITHDVDPLALTFLRFVMAAAIFAGLMAGSGHLARPTIGDMARYATISILLCIYFVTMFYGLRWADPVSLGAIFTLAPLFTAGISRLLVGQRTSLAVAAGLTVAASGAIWVLFDGSLERLAGFAVGCGEWIFLVGTMAYATYSPMVRKLHRGESLLVMNFWVLLLGAVMLATVGASAITDTSWTALSWRVYAGIAWLAAVSTALSFSMIKYASLHLPAAKVLAYTYLIPALVLAQTTLLGGPRPSLSEAAGIMVITGAMLVLQRTG